MPDNPSLSVIIPVFNVEDYLSKCIDSLFKTPGIEDIEIILIDDGSTDNSGKLADRLAEEYSNIRVFHRNNEGPSAARNFGIREARGTYVSFVDSDDEVVPNLFAKVIKLAVISDSDMFLWDSELTVEDGGSLASKKEDFFSHAGLEKTERTYGGKELLEVLIRNCGNFVATVWLGAYKRSYLMDNGFYFEPGLIHEDEYWVPKVMINAKSIHYIPEKIYRYRIRKGSIMNPKSKDLRDHVDSLMKIYPSLYEYYDEVLAGEPLKELIEANLTKKYLHMIYRFNVSKYGYGKMVDKKLLWRKSGRLIDKMMALGLYIFVH